MTDYITSDLHLAHRNIIRYCSRPFSSVEEMDRTLIQNWNDTVMPDDTVYFLGDLTIKRTRFYTYLEALNGIKVLVKGNHDPDTEGIPVMLIKNLSGIPVLFIHSPHDIPDDYDGWVIHGHSHNNTEYINHDTKRVNVSVENTGYRPVALEEIVGAIV